MSDDRTTQETVSWCRQRIPERTFRDTGAFPDAQLIACLDAIAAFHSGSDRVAADFRDELRRREMERQGRRLERLTWALVALTIVVTIATLVLVWSELQH